MQKTVQVDDAALLCTVSGTGDPLVHEPPLSGIDAIRDRVELQPLNADVEARLLAAGRQVRAGDPRGGVARFIEEVTLGPGAWERLPEEVRQTMVDIRSREPATCRS